MLRIRYCSILILLLLSACQSKQLAELQKTTVEFSSGYYQLYPGWPAPAQQLLQHIVWQSDDQSREFLLSAMLTEEQVLLVATSVLGQELWRLQYNRSGIIQLTGIAPFNQPIVARRILAEMQLALLPVELLQPGLHNLKLTEQTDLMYQRYLIDQNGQPLLHILWQGTPEPRHKVEVRQQNYQLTITTLQKDIL